MVLALVCLLIVVSDVYAQAPPALNFTVESFVVEGDNPLDRPTTDAALKPFLGAHSGLDGLQAAADALKAELAANAYPFHRVELPADQNVFSGTIIFKVLKFGVGELRIKGNQNFTDDNVRSSLPKLLSADTPDVRELRRSLAVANQHPRKGLTATLRESETLQDALDTVVTVQDLRPWSVFANINNIGNKDTGRTRLLIGAQHSNVTKHDDVLTATISTSPDNADDVFQFGAFYQLPVYKWSGWFSAFYVKSDVDVGNVQDFFDISGSGDFIGISFKRELIPVGRYRHSLTVGLQDRGFETAIFNASTGTFIPGISTKVRSRPLSVRYEGAYNWTSSSFDFFVEALNNMSFGGHNDDLAYQKVRPVAESAWKALRFSLLGTTRLPQGFTGVAKLSGQYTQRSTDPGRTVRSRWREDRTGLRRAHGCR